MCSQEDLEALELFNEKAEVLKNSRFMKFLLERGSGLTISQQRGQPIKIEPKWPDWDAINAFVLTFRFFIQKKEKSSFRYMAKVYDRPPIPQQKKDSFKNAHGQLNELLGSHCPIVINGRTPTYNEIIRIIIYGQLAHRDEKKKAIYDQWMSHWLLKPTLTNEFVYILGLSMGIIAHVQKLNEEVLKELSEKK